MRQATEARRRVVDSETPCNVSLPTTLTTRSSAMPGVSTGIPTGRASHSLTGSAARSPTSPRSDRLTGRDDADPPAHKFILVPTPTPESSVGDEEILPPLRRRGPASSPAPPTSMSPTDWFAQTKAVGLFMDRHPDSVASLFAAYAQVSCIDTVSMWRHGTSREAVARLRHLRAEGELNWANFWNRDGAIGGKGQHTATGAYLLTMCYWTKVESDLCGVLGLGNEHAASLGPVRARRAFRHLRDRLLPGVMTDGIGEVGRLDLMVDVQGAGLTDPKFLRDLRTLTVPGGTRNPAQYESTTYIGGRTTPWYLCLYDKVRQMLDTEKPGWGAIPADFFRAEGRFRGHEGVSRATRFLRRGHDLRVRRGKRYVNLRLEFDRLHMALFSFLVRLTSDALYMSRMAMRTHARLLESCYPGVLNKIITLMRGDHS